MPQQFLALAIILFFIFRVFKNWRKKRISAGEFAFWLIFWILSAGAVIFIRQIDKLISLLGFSGAGINFLLYLAVMILFYFLFRLRIELVKIEKDITKIVRNITLNKQDKQSQNSNFKSE